MAAEGAEGGEEAPAATPAPFLTYARIFASMLDGVLVAASDERVVLANEAAARVFEVPLRDLLVPVAEYPDRFDLREPSGTRSVPVAQRALHGEVVAPVERLIRTPAGVVKAIRTSASPIRDDHGAIMGAVVLVGDIDAAKAQADRERGHEVALRESEARYRTLFESIDEGFCVIEVLFDAAGAPNDFRFLEVNRAFERQSGLAGALGRRMRELAPSHERSWFEIYGRVAVTGEAARFESHAAAFGRWYDVFAFRVGRPDQHRVAILFDDVTERRRAEDALRQSEARLRQHAGYLEHAPVLVRSTDDRILMWNAGMERLYGYRRAEALGRVSHELLQTRFPRPLPEITALLLRDGRWEGELVHRHRSGAAVTVASLWVLHRDEQERPEAIIEINNDITARKKAEDALREADQRKTEFLGVLSHELRNPLAPIRTAIHLLDRVPADTARAARARLVIRRQTEQLARLVDDLLDVTRISRGKVTLHRQVVDLRDLVRRTSEDHRVMFEQSGLELRLDLPASPAWADVDPARIAQVVGNLLQNAIKFTPREGVVSVSVRAHDGAVEIRVGDTGIGMAPERVEHMFEPFAQEERGLARTRGGLGLGLALAKGLVELHGGAIAAHSAGAGRGSEFVLTLPATGAPENVEASPSAGAAAVAAEQIVLLIEDNLDAAETLAEVLTMEGHQVHVARDGRTGIRMAHELEPDAVICDIGLPDMDGYEVARALRRDESLRRTRLIALSGYAQPEDKERAREAGFDAHLPKPAPVSALYDHLSAERPRLG